MTKAIFHLRQFRLLLLVLLCALFSLPLSAQKAYVAESKDETTLTFYYDAKRQSRSGETWNIDEKSYYYISCPWAGTYNSPNERTKRIVFDASFKDYRPTTTNSWFSCLRSLTTIEGIENINTSKVIDMSYMFYGCSSLKTIFSTGTWRSYWSENMFKGCTQLKGAVKYDESKVDETMANPTTGYFSQKLPSAIGRVVFDDSNATQIYNLQGKRVNANQRHLPAGFYIVNGKKVYLNEKP